MFIHFINVNGTFTFLTRLAIIYLIQTGRKIKGRKKKWNIRNWRGGLIACSNLKFIDLWGISGLEIIQNVVDQNYVILQTNFLLVRLRLLRMAIKKMSKNLHFNASSLIGMMECWCGCMCKSRRSGSNRIKFFVV